MKSIILLFILISGLPAVSQDLFSVDAKNSQLSILGTSTLHDWESMVGLYTASATADQGALKNVALTVTVKSIKSGKSGMDKNTYAALKADEYPTISFKASQLQISDSSLTGNGQLTIGGMTNTIPVNLEYQQGTDDSFQIVGEIRIRMTEFGIEPPVALLGAVKTGDEVTINATLHLKK